MTEEQKKDYKKQADAIVSDYVDHKLSFENYVAWTLSLIVKILLGL